MVVYMLKTDKNYFNCNELILKGMLKRRRLAVSAIYNICDIKEKIRIVK